MSSKVLFYCTRMSSCAHRVRTGLHFKKIAYEPIYIDLYKGDQFSNNYKNINPMQYIPALEIDGHVISESIAILEYLEETRPNPALMPKTPIERAQIRSLCELFNSGIQPLTNLKVLQYIKKKYQGNKREFGEFWIKEGLRAAEKKVEKTKGIYTFGDSVTMADIFLYAQTVSAKNVFKINLEEFPNLNEIRDNLDKVKDFSDASPEKITTETQNKEIQIKFLDQKP